MNFDSVVENKFKEAFEAGKFDNLPGQGKPLNLHENPHEPEAWRMASKMLKDQGFTLAWISERKEIEEALEKALSLLAQTYRTTHRVKNLDVWAQADRQKAQATFIEPVGKL